MTDQALPVEPSTGRILRTMRSGFTFLAVLAVSMVVTSASLRADDYPQWLGPQRDGIYREGGVIAAMPSGGLQQRWRVPVGGGYSGPAVWNQKVFVTDRQVAADAAKAGSPFKRGSVAGVERILCLDERDGSVLWKVEYDCLYTISYAAGPRCTPTVDPQTGLVYTLGSEGHLYCIDSNTGKTAWNLKLDGPTPMWGFSGHPLIDGPRLLVLASGKPALTIAFDKRTGKILWQSDPAEREPGYTPPMIRTLGGQRQVIQWNPTGIVSLDPETGKTLWAFKYGPVKFGAAITAPALVGDIFVMSSEYEGAAGAKLEPSGRGARQIWRVDKRGKVSDTLNNLMSPLLAHDGIVVGVHSEGHLRAIDPATGKVAWDAADPVINPRASVRPKLWFACFMTPHQPDPAAPPKQFFVANDSGDLILASINARGYTELGRTRLLEPTNTDAGRPVLWCHPAYANQSIYWRNDKELGCWSLKP